MSVCLYILAARIAASLSSGVRVDIELREEWLISEKINKNILIFIFVILKIFKLIKKNKQRIRTTVIMMHVVEDPPDSWRVSVV